jgi:hypothetical protein
MIKGERNDMGMAEDMGVTRYKRKKTPRENP